jgi:acyl-CoA thioesterase-1
MRLSALLVAALLPLCESALASGENCAAPPDIFRLTAPLPRTEARLNRRETLTIVALGSSSTAGFGASLPARSYPSRLAVELGNLLPGAPIRIYNKGVGGETETEMVARFERDVFALRPDLVIWQVGANAVVRDLDLARYDATVRDGLRRLKGAGIDVVMMDLQYAPRIIAHPAFQETQANIARDAAEEHVAVFRRFDIMRHWVETRQLDFKRMLLGDGLHLNDLSYGCIARLLAAAIVDGARPAPGSTQTSNTP